VISHFGTGLEGEIHTHYFNLKTNYFLRIQSVLEPLAIAANVSQASHTRLDHVLLTLGNLFRQYSDTESTTFDEDLRLAVINSLEKRWKKTDQDGFIVAVFLNPYIQARLFKQQFLTEAQLYNIVERVYERIMRCRADLGFMDAFEDYKRSRREFSDDYMSLVLMKRRFADAVCYFKFISCIQKSDSIPTYRIFQLISNASGHALTRVPSLVMMDEMV
jgi:hypothetical protein